MQVTKILEFVQLVIPIFRERSIVLDDQRQGTKRGVGEKAPWEKRGKEISNLVAEPAGRNSVFIIGMTNTLVGDHARTDRVFRGAGHTEGRTIRR